MVFPSLKESAERLSAGTWSRLWPACWGRLWQLRGFRRKARTCPRQGGKGDPRQLLCSRELPEEWRGRQEHNSALLCPERCLIPLRQHPARSVRGTRGVGGSAFGPDLEGGREAPFETPWDYCSGSSPYLGSFLTTQVQEDESPCDKGTRNTN